jgi:hypothetical protein
MAGRGMAPRGEQVFVQMLTGRTLVLDVEWGDTVADAKQKIKDKTDIPLIQQRLATRTGKNVECGRMLLGDYGIHKETTLWLRLHLANACSMNTEVKTISGDKFSVTVAPHDTVAVIKASVSAARGGVAVAQIKLIFAGKVLTDDAQTADALGLNDASFLVLVVTKAKTASAAVSVAASAPTAAPAVVWRYASPMPRTAGDSSSEDGEGWGGGMPPGELE